MNEMSVNEENRLDKGDEC